MMPGVSLFPFLSLSLLFTVFSFRGSSATAVKRSEEKWSVTIFPRDPPNEARNLVRCTRPEAGGRLRAFSTNLLATPGNEITEVHRKLFGPPAINSRCLVQTSRRESSKIRRLRLIRPPATFSYPRRIRVNGETKKTMYSASSPRAQTSVAIAVGRRSGDRYRIIERFELRAVYNSGNWIFPNLY